MKHYSIILLTVCLFYSASETLKGAARAEEDLVPCVQVKISGLSQTPELNGHLGTQEGYDASIGRYIIRLNSDSRRLLSLRPENVTFVCLRQTHSDTREVNSERSSSPEADLMGIFAGLAQTFGSLNSLLRSTYPTGVPSQARGMSTQEISSLGQVRPCTEAESLNICSICREPPTVGQPLRHLPCSHVFHQGCVDRWLQSASTCPECRRNFR